jgi:hypothetical protein
MTEPFSAPRSGAEVYPEMQSRLEGPDARGVTLAAVDRALGYTTHASAAASPLWGRWYEAVSALPLQNLADDDLARALDAALHVPLVLPLALRRLRAPAEAGAPPERLLLAAGRAARRIRARLPQLFEETRQALKLLQASDALEELERVVPLESGPWRDVGPSMPAARDESRAADTTPVRSPHSPPY